MGIENTICKEIYDEIDRLCLEKPDVINIDVIRDCGSSLRLRNSSEFYLDQPPDTNPEAVIERPNLLGSYTSMSSPGRLVLYRKNLRDFFWSVVVDVLYQDPTICISKNDLKNTAYVIVRKTCWHEKFHFCCDVFRHLFASSFDSLTEEALAVAYSRQKILAERQNRTTSIAKIHSHFFGLVMEKAFAYTSPGYRDWPKYIDQEVFGQKLLEYAMKPRGVLASNGVNLSDLPRGMIESLLAKEHAGYIETIV